MSNLIEDTPKRELAAMLRQIHDREIALPDFQRDFVWDPAATQELIVSMAMNYPAGSLLAIRNTQNYFAARSIEGAPALGANKPTYLILDGQQRLTSLYQAFYGAGDYHYFVNLRAILEGKDPDESIFHLKINVKRGVQAQLLRRYETTEGQIEDLVFPLRYLFGQPDGYLGWADLVSESIPDKDKRIELKDSLRALRKKGIENIEKYTFPVVLLSDSTPSDAVCTIFETLNRTGVKLSVFDLLAARFWPHDVKLREMWEKALEDYPVLGDFEIDPYYLLQTLALLRSDMAPSCKRKDILSLKPIHVRDEWDTAVKGLTEALAILQEDCGVLIPKWLPYSTLLIPFAALLAKHPPKNGMEEGGRRQKMVQWFWCSVFSQAYENSPNFQAAKDLVEVGAWLAGGNPPDWIANFTFEQQALFEVTPKQRALYRGVICLILAGIPRDFHTRRPITKALIRENDVDDHHIFPAAYLEMNGFPEAKRRDCVLNRTLIDRTTNQVLNKRSPKDYFGQIRGEKWFPDLLKSHILPGMPDSPLMVNGYETFLSWRCDEIGSRIRSATTGISLP